MIQCPICQGEKAKIYTTILVGRNGTRIFSVQEVPCALCKGRGTLSSKEGKSYINTSSSFI